jgi:hypothetical protein
VSEVIQGVCRGMKTTTLLATLVGASTLLFIQPVFAQTDNDSIAEIGSGAWGSSDSVDSDQAKPSSYGASTPSFDGWGDAPVLAPAPKLPEAPGPVYSDPAMPPSYAATLPPYGDTAPSYGDTPPSFEETWRDGSVLTAAPGQPEAPAPESAFVPQGPVGLIERPGLAPISPTSPELIAPDAFARPAGGFQSPVGGFHSPVGVYNGRIH